MRRRHVLWLGEEAPPTVFARMAGDPPATMEDLDGGRGRAHFDVLADQAVRDRVPARIELDVVIDVDGSGRLPEGELVGRRWQRLQCGAFELLEQLPPRDRLATKRSIVDQRYPFSNRGVEFGQREELPFAEWREHASFRYQHPGFHGGLIARPIRPAGQDGHRVYARQLEVTRIQAWLVPAGFRDARLEVFRVVWPTGLCGPGQPKAAVQSGNPWRRPESRHITQVS